MKKVILEFKSGKTSTYEIVTFRTSRKGKKEVLFNDVDALISNPNVVSHKFVEPKRSKSDGSSESKVYVSKNVHENINMPMVIADEIVSFAKGDGKGFTKEVVEKWNKHFDFDLHSKFERYGFSGSSRLNTIFKI